LTEAVASRVLGLPVAVDLSDNAIDDVVTALACT